MHAYIDPKLQKVKVARTLMHYTFTYNTAHQDGNWGDWGDWGDCSLDCGTGQRQKQRSCNNPAPEGTGDQCATDINGDTMVEDCNTQACVGGMLLVM